MRKCYIKIASKQIEDEQVKRTDRTVSAQNFFGGKKRHRKSLVMRNIPEKGLVNRRLHGVDNSRTMPEQGKVLMRGKLCLDDVVVNYLIVIGLVVL